MQCQTTKINMRSRRAGIPVIPGPSHIVPLLIVLQFFAFTSEALSVGGISNSKIIVPSAETVPKKHVEIEPFFALELVDDEDNTVRFGGGVRFTLGTLDNLEIGTNVNYLDYEDSDLIQSDSNFGDIESGLKYRFFDEGERFPFSLAYQGGVTFPVSDGASWVIEPAGLILTKNFTERVSLDADLVVVVIENDSWGFVTEAGLGYFFNEWFQAVVEGAYVYEDPDGDENTSVINVTAGFTATATEWLTIILGITPDVYAGNEDRHTVISAAFTFFF